MAITSFCNLIRLLENNQEENFCSPVENLAHYLSRFFKVSIKNRHQH